MKAIWNGTVIAEADKDDLIYIERNWYFPPASVKQDFLRKSDNSLHLPVERRVPILRRWPGRQMERRQCLELPGTEAQCHRHRQKDFSNYVAFWRDVQVTE